MKNITRVFELLQDFWGLRAGSLFEVSANGFVELSFGWGDDWQIPAFILKGNPSWFEDVSFKDMTKEERVEQIKILFNKLKKAHDWCREHFPEALGLEGAYLASDEVIFNTKLLPAVEGFYDSLESLGVDKSFSASLFITGSAINNQELLKNV